MRSPYLAAIPAAVAVAAAGARWLIQGSGNVYSALEKRFYVADPDLGWRVASDTPIWIGLEVIGILVAVAIGIVGAAFVIRRIERKRGTAWRWPRIAAWIVAALPLVIPIAAFATGLGPDGGREALPRGVTAAPPERGIEGDLGRPAGRYEVVKHAGTAITARVAAGKEAFDARFAGDIQGVWVGDPSDLTTPMTADVSAAAASVDTGIELRSKHAREEYLYADKFPRIGFALRRVLAARQDAPDVVVFRAEGAVSLMGKAHVVETTGTMRALDGAAAQRIGLAGQTVLAVQADLQLKISQTALAADADSFDNDLIPINVALVLVHRGPPNRETAGVKR